MTALTFEASRDGYTIDQVRNGAMTVGELIDILNDYAYDTPIILSHDHGYTYGSLGEYHEWEQASDGDWFRM